MSFYISLSGLKGAQSELTTVANNVANVSSTAFKKSRAAFGDIFVGQSDGKGQGVRMLGSQQQHTQGTLEATDKTLDIAITGEGFFTVRSAPPSNTISYTRNGAFSLDKNRNVLDTKGSRLQVLPVNASGNITSTAAADLAPLVIPTSKVVAAVTVDLSSIAIDSRGVVSATFADGSVDLLGAIGMANFPNQEGLQQKGDAHWIASGKSGVAVYGQAETGTYGSMQSGMLERSNVDITEELVGLISAQRNFQANAKAIEAANTLSTTINNLRS